MTLIRGSAVAVVAAASIVLLSVASVYAQGASTAGAAGPSQVSLSWLDILGLVAGTGVVSALLTHGLESWRNSRKERAETARSAGYVALRLAVILEEFAIACVDMVDEADVSDMTSGLRGIYHTTLPPLTDYPTDTDWKALELSLSARALSFRNELHASNLHVAWVGREEFVEGGHACVKEAAKCGYSALDIAADLRSSYSLPKCDFSRDFVAAFKERRDKAV